MVNGEKLQHRSVYRSLFTKVFALGAVHSVVLTLCRYPEGGVL
jgi:hypothetical protein